MSHSQDRLAQDISLWLSGETVTEAADRAVAGLECTDDARRTAGAAIAIEDLVRGWYGSIPSGAHSSRRRSRPWRQGWRWHF